MLGRLKGADIYAARKSVVNAADESTNDPTDRPLFQQEKWQKRAPKKKSKYYSHPVHLEVHWVHLSLEVHWVTSPWSREGTLNDVKITLTNTCTVDNLGPHVRNLLTHKKVA